MSRVGLSTDTKSWGEGKFRETEVIAKGYLFEIMNMF
jgi:hypothetical protein